MYPVLFNLGDTPIYAYGFLIALALILGWVLSLRLARADKLPADLLGTSYVISVAVGLIAARAMWLFQHPERSGDISELIQLQAGGLAGAGGILAGLIVAGVYCQAKNIPPWAWLDCVAPAFLLGVVLERVAAFLSGADFGHYVDPHSFVATVFPAESPVYDIQRREWSGLRLPADHSLPVHPSQLYAAVAALLGFAITFVIRSRRRYSGQVALFALGYYAIVRYLVEDPFRYDGTPTIAGPVTLGQVAAIAIVIVVALTHFTRLAKVAESPSELAQWTGGPWTPGYEDPAKAAKKKKSGKKKASAQGEKATAGKPESKASEPEGD